MRDISPRSVDCVLALRQCQFFYQDECVLSVPEFSVREGELLYVQGTNGSGKTTFLKGIAGLRPRIAGKATLFHQDLLQVTPLARQSMGLIYVPQGGPIFGHLTVSECVRLAQSRRRFSENPFRMNEIKVWFPLLDQIWKSPGRVLSGGERAIASLSCGLIRNPRFLLLDEPTLGLSTEYRNIVTDLVNCRFNRQSLSIVLVDHLVRQDQVAWQCNYIISNRELAQHD